MSGNPIQNIASFFDPNNLSRVFVNNGNPLSSDSDLQEFIRKNAGDNLEKLIQNHYLSITDRYNIKYIIGNYVNLTDAQKNNLKNYLSANPNVNLKNILNK
jgi:hypothetical protein